VGLEGGRKGGLVGGEVSAFSIVAVVGEEELRADKEDFGIEKEDSTVVADAVMKDGHAQVNQNVVGEVGLEEGGQRFVAVEEGVLF